MIKRDIFVAVRLVLVFYTTRRVKGPGMGMKLQKPDFKLWGNFSPEILSKGK